MTFVEIVGLLGGIGLSVLLGVVLGRYAFPTIKQSDLDAAEAATKFAGIERDRFRDRVVEIEQQNSESTERLKLASEDLIRANERLAHADESAQEKNKLFVDCERDRDVAREAAKNAREEAAVLSERADGLAAQLSERAGHVHDLETRLKLATEFAKTVGDEAVRLTERERSLGEQLLKQAADFQEQKASWTTEFENIASRILKSNSSDLTEKSGQLLSSIVLPLREKIGEFQERVQSTYEAESRDVTSLKEQIRLVLDVSQTVGSHADGLAKALRGDAGLRGRWGELALERILEKAGLTEGREYVTQGRGLGLRNEDGVKQKPDVVVLLPDARSIIIDSKLPLLAYDRMVAAEEPESRARFAEQLVRDMKTHIDGLSGKKYQETPTLPAHDCVLMFVPVEGALAAALTKEPELFTYAWDRRVVLVGPPTLLMTLRTVACIWQYENQNQHTQEIARLAGYLCDKVVDSLSDLSCAAEKIESALDCHKEAVKRLSTGKGNVLRIGGRMRALGVRMKKQLPAMELDADIEEALSGTDDRFLAAAETMEASPSGETEFGEKGDAERTLQPS